MRKYPWAERYEEQQKPKELRECEIYDNRLHISFL